MPFPFAWKTKLALCIAFSKAQNARKIDHFGITVELKAYLMVSMKYGLIRALVFIAPVNVVITYNIVMSKSIRITYVLSASIPRGDNSLSVFALIRQDWARQRLE